MSKFELWEIAVLQKCNVLANEGKECEIIGLNTYRFVYDEFKKDRYSKECYIVRLQNGEEYAVEEYQLKKKKPPDKDVSFSKWLEKWNTHKEPEHV